MDDVSLGDGMTPRPKLRWHFVVGKGREFDNTRSWLGSNRSSTPNPSFKGGEHGSPSERWLLEYMLESAMDEPGDKRPFLPSVEFVRLQRNNPTEAEWILWQALRKSRIGFKFTRQHPIGGRFADFCCRQRKLVVELDGESHDSRQEEDESRDKFFADQGYLVLRFRNELVVDHLEAVAESIRIACDMRPQWRY